MRRLPYYFCAITIGWLTSASPALKPTGREQSTQQPNAVGQVSQRLLKLLHADGNRKAGEHQG